MIFRANLLQPHKNNNLFILKDSPFLDLGDQVLLKKTKNMKFTFKEGRRNHPIYGKNSFYAFEHLDISHLRYIKTDCFNWHFPIMKDRKIITEINGVNIERDLDIPLIPFNKLKEIIDVEACHISEDMLDENRILTLMRKFNNIRYK